MKQRIGIAMIVVGFISAQVISVLFSANDVPLSEWRAALPMIAFAVLALVVYAGGFFVVRAADRAESRRLWGDE